MQTEFRIVGLSKPNKVTCETSLHDHFWPTVNVPQDRFDGLWTYCKGEWETEYITGIIEHDGWQDDEPKNPILIEIRIK